MTACGAAPGPEHPSTTATPTATPTAPATAITADEWILSAIASTAARRGEQAIASTPDRGWTAREPSGGGVDITRPRVFEPG